MRSANGMANEVGMDEIDDILSFWFGRIETTVVPTENRARIWFSHDDEVDELIRSNFSSVLERAIAGDCDHWQQTPRGQLALILVLDQFSRHIYRGLPDSYYQDQKALAVCESGMFMDADHHLSLVERLFYYFPLLHAEEIYYQNKGLASYQLLNQIALEETQIVYNSFVKFANHHYMLISRFGRFPQRNRILQRESTADELLFLDTLEEQQ